MYVEGHPIYRRRPVNRLVQTAVLFITLLAYAQMADAAPVSRYDILEKACTVFWNHTLDEPAALRSNLLEPFPDGRIHLDWPATRGTALLILYKLLELETIPASSTASFADIAPGTSLASAAALLSKRFDPSAKRRFMPDRLLGESDLKELLIRIKNECRIPGEPPEWLVPRVPAQQQSSSRNAETAFEQHFPTDFKFDDPLKQQGGAEELGATDARRLDRMHGFVAPDQMAPQEDFDLTTALTGMADLEKTLDSLEITVYDLTTLEIPQERISDTLNALDEIAEILVGATDKLRFSRQHLEAAILTDPERLRDAAGLRVRIVDGLRRVMRLKEKIDTSRPALAANEQVR